MEGKYRLEGREKHTIFTLVTSSGAVVVMTDWAF